MGEIKIETGIPIPAKHNVGRASHGGLVGAYATFRQMSKGESVFFERPDGVAKTKFTRSACGIAGIAGRRTGKKFMTRSVTKKGVEGVRVWCLEDGAQ